MDYSKGDAFKEVGEAKKARSVATDKAGPSIETLSDYTKSEGVNPTKALYDIATNIRNARATYAADTSGIPTLFSTNMFELAERIQPLLKDGLEALKKIEEERAALYRCK